MAEQDPFADIVAKVGRETEDATPAGNADGDPFADIVAKAEKPSLVSRGINTAARVVNTAANLAITTADRLGVAPGIAQERDQRRGVEAGTYAQGDVRAGAMGEQAQARATPAPLAERPPANPLEQGIKVGATMWKSTPNTLDLKAAAERYKSAEAELGRLAGPGPTGAAGPASFWKDINTEQAGGAGARAKELAGQMVQDKAVVNEALQIWRQYQQEQQAAGKGVPEFTDVMGGKGDFSTWLAFNLGQGGAIMVPLILASVIPGVGPAVAAGGAAALNVGDIQSQRLEANDPQYGSAGVGRPSAIEAGMEAAKATIDKVHSEGNVVMATAAVYTVLDFALGPLGRAITGKMGREAASAAVAALSKSAIAKEVLKAFGFQTIEEGINEGGQEFLSVLMEKALDGKDILTADTAKRLINAAAAGAASGGPIGAVQRAGEIGVAKARGIDTGSPAEPGGGAPNITGPFTSVSTNFTPVEGGFQAPNGAVITPEQWDNASPRVRAGWMQEGEQAPTVPRETMPEGVDVAEAEEITAAPAPAGLEPENEIERVAELRRLADDTDEPGVKRALLNEALALEQEMADIDTGSRQASELERLAAASADPTVAEKLQARAAKLRQAMAPPTRGIKVEEQGLDEMVGQTPQTPLSAKGIKVEEGTVEEIAVDDVDPFQPSKPERRRNAEQRAKVAEMSPEQMRRELLTSPVTGLGNKRAWEEAPRAPSQTNVDVDSLKWVNDNLGHEVGDVLLAKVGAAFQAVGAEAYHLSGDEFRVQAESPEAAAAIMRKVNALLKKEEVSTTLPDGTVVRKKGIGVSHGHGNTVDEAERALQKHKSERQKKGVRPERGAEPRGVDRSKPGPRSDAGSAGVSQPRGVAKRPAKRRAQATPAEPQTLGQSPLLQKLVDTARGLRKSLLSELNFDARDDKGKSINWSMGGRGQLFRNEEGLESGDEIVEWLEQNGYLSQAQIDEAELTKTGGSHELAWEMLRSEISDPGSVVPLAKTDDKAAAEVARRARFDLEREAAELGIDTSLPDDELADKVQAAFIDKAGLTLPEAYDAELAHQASQLDEAAFERAAMQFADDDAAFMRAIREILNGNDKAAGRRSQDDESAPGAVAPQPGASLEGPQDPQAREAGGQAAGDAQQGARPEQARPDDEGRVEEPRPGLDGDAAARTPRVKRDGYTTDLFGAPLPSPQGVGVDTGVAAAARAPADSTPAGALPKGSTALVDVVTRRIGAFKVPAQPIDSAKSAAQAFAYLRKYPREYLDALIVDADDAPIAHWRGFMGAQSQTSVYPAELAKFAASVPGAAGIWMAHNHPSGLAVPSRADENLTVNIVNLLRDVIPLKGHVVVAGTNWVDVRAPQVGGTIPPTLRTREIPVLERVVLKTGNGAPINSPTLAKAAVEIHLGSKPGLIFVDTQNRFIASVPYEDLARPRMLRNTGEAAKLMGIVARINPGSVILSTGQPGTAANVGMNNVAGLFRGLDVRVLDAVSSDGTSYAERGLDNWPSDFAARGPLWYSPLATALEAVKTESAPPAQWIGTIKGLKGVSPSEIEWSGVIEWLEMAARVAGKNWERDAIGPGEWPALMALEKGKLSRAAVIDFITNNGVKVQEVTLSNDVDNEAQQLEIQALTQEYQTWLRANRLPQVSADELAADFEISVQQRAYVDDFLSRWEAAQVTNRADRLRVRLTALGYQPEFDNGTGELTAIVRQSDRRMFVSTSTPGVWREPANDLRQRETETLDSNTAGLAEELLSLTLPDAGFEMPSDRNREPRYGDYTLPGGKNYREILLTLPVKEAEIPEGWRLYDEALDDRAAGYPVPDSEVGRYWRFKGPDIYSRRYNSRAEALAAIQAEIAQGGTVGTFQSSHFDEPNIVAHLRLTDRTDADGKRVLFVEEIQSDWAQKGRRGGFSKDTTGWTAESLSAPDHAGFTHWLIRDADGNRVTNIVGGNKEGAISKAAEGVPRAPFVEKTDAWAALALKRAIKYAIDNGFERVAWTTGRQQADRYSLRKHIESLAYIRHGDGTYTIKGIPKGRNADWHTFARDVPANDVSDYVGKEMADKIIANPEASGLYHGVDLEVGGEGMLGFYDRILPKLANDVLKKLGGGKVGAVALGGGGYGVDRVIGKGWRVVNAQNLPVDDKTFRNQQDALRWIVENDPTRRQPSFDITPEMRASAQRGMPLFKRDEAPTPRIPQPMGVRPFPQPRAPQTPKELAERKASVRASLVDAFGPELIDNLERLGILRLETAEENPSRMSLIPEVRAVYSDRDYRGPGASIFYDRIDPRDAPRLVAHEIGEHYGLIRMLGDNGYYKLLAQVAAAHDRGDPEIRAAWAYVKAAYTEDDGTLMYPEGSDPFVREVAAVVIEQAPYRGWVREVLDTVRAWLYRLVGEMPFLGVDSNLLRGLASAALRSAALGQLPRVRTKDAMAAAIVRSPALDRLNESQMEAVDRRLAAMGVDGARLRANLVNPDLSQTPWAKQTVDGLLIRAAIDEYVAGREPGFANPLDDPLGESLRERLKRGGADAIWDHLNRTGLVGDAGKPVNNVNSSFANCDPSPACATYCYATRGNYPAFNPTVKAELTNWAVETDPAMAAAIISRNYKGRLEFEQGKALRLFDKGDGSAAWLPVIKQLNANGIRTQIFSKRPEFLRQVSPFNVRLLSVDSTNLEVARANPDLPIAFIYTDPSQIDFLNEVKDRVQVILPVKLGNRLMTPEEIKALPAWTKVYQCPIDNGAKKLPSVKGSEGWVCTKCDKNAGIGCFRGQSTAAMLKAAAAPPKPGPQLDKAAQEIRDVIERSIPEGQREDANRILDGLMAAIRAGVDISAEGAGTQGDPGQRGNAAVSVVRFFPGEPRRVSREDAEAPGPAAQDVTRFEGEGGRLPDEAAAKVPSKIRDQWAVDRDRRPNSRGTRITLTNKATGKSWVAFSQQEAQDIMAANSAPLLPDDAAARGPRSRPTPTPPVNASNLDAEDAIGVVTRKMFDRFNRVRQLQRRIPGIPDNKNVVQADTLYYGRAQFLGEELERNYVEPLAEALKAAGKLKATVRDADDYLMAKHAPERNRVIAQRNQGFARGGGSGMTDQQAAAILAGFTPQQTAALEEVGRIVYAMNVDKLQRLATSGVITVQLAQLLTQQYQFYVPLKNIDDEADAHGIGRGYEIRNSGIEMSFGRASKAGSPIANSMIDAARAIVLSEKARVDQVLWNLAQDPAVGDVLVPMDDALAQTTFNRQRYNATTQQIETVVDGAWRNRDDVVKLRIAGEEQYLWVRDDLLRDQLRKVATLNDPGPVLRAVGKVTGTIGRTLTEFNPSFTLPNGVRDAISVFIRARGVERVRPAAVMAGIPVAWKMIVDFKRDAQTPGAQMYREFQEDGGKTGAYGITDAVDTFHHLERLGAELGYADRERGLGTKGWHALGTMAKWISHGNEVIEYATRLSMYREARAQGYSRQQAALWGKEISVNFNRSGEYGRTLNSAFVFANAALQGLYGTIMFGKSHKVRMAMIGLVVLGAAAQAWNEEGGGDDEETGDRNVNTLSEFALDHNATVLAPGSAQGVKIPLPPEYAFLYATGRRLYRAMSQGDVKREAAGIAGAFLGSTLPLRAPDASSIPISSLKAITPTAILPFADIALNENFMGAPIVTEQRNRQAPQPYVVLSRRNTSDLAKATAELVNTATGGDRIEPGLAQQAFGPFVSAEAMEHVVGYYTGGVGQFALQSTNMVKALAGDEEAVDVNKIPIANRFIFKQPQGYVSRRYRELAPKFQYAIAREREGTTTDLIEPQVASALPEYRGAERELRLLFADLRRAGEEGDKPRTKDLEQQIRQVQTRVIRAYNEARE